MRALLASRADAASAPSFPFLCATGERAALHDALASSVLAAAGGSGVAAPARPWLVLTAGAMGAGKSHTLRALASAQPCAFPLLRAAVLVDPDALKLALPELRAHLSGSQPELAHTRVHAESGFIAELVERAALMARRHVIVDGTLRDTRWYAARIGRLRAEFPAYRVAILLVTAPRELVLARAERRARATGRHVPRATLDDAMARCPRSYAALAPLADYSCVIHNDADGAPPRVALPETLESFAKTWRGAGGGGMEEEEAAADRVKSG